MNHSTLNQNQSQVKKSLPPILQAYANERKAIAYRPEFAKMTGSVLGAILLQQILYRFDHGDCDKFYKFSQPCKHKLYKEGDSWTEELAFSRTELATALKKIGTKSVAGTNKSELMAVTMPDFDDKGYLKNSAQLVVYWTDKNRVTWYWLNTVLLGNAINQHYLGKSGNMHYLVNQDSSNTYEKQETRFTSIPKITKEKAEKKKPAPKVVKPLHTEKAETIVNAWGRARGFAALDLGAPIGSDDDWKFAEEMALWERPPTDDEIRLCVKNSKAYNYPVRFLKKDVVDLRAKNAKKVINHNPELNTPVEFVPILLQHVRKEDSA